MSEAEPAGHVNVDAALEALAEVASLPPRDQVTVYAEAHRTLQDTLNTIEER